MNRKAITLLQAVQSVLERNDIFGKLEALPRVDAAWLSIWHDKPGKAFVFKLAVQCGDEDVVMDVTKIPSIELWPGQTERKVSHLIETVLEHSYVALACEMGRKPK